MKKQFKRYISRFLVVVFLSNIVVISDAKAMEVPLAVAVAVEITVETLMSTGIYLAGFISTFIHNKTFISTTVAKKDALNSAVVALTVPTVVPSIAVDVVTGIIEAETKLASIAGAAGVCNGGKDSRDGAAVVVDSALRIAQMAEAVNGVGRVAGANIANQELVKIVKEQLSEGSPVVYSSIPFVPKIFVLTPTPEGLQLSIPTLERFGGLISFNGGVANEARAQRLADLAMLQKMQHLLQHNPVYKTMVVADMQVVVECLVLTQSDNLAESIPACLVLEKLYIQSPLNDRLIRTVREVKEIYFRDGALYDKAFTQKTKAAGSIIEFIDDVEKFTKHAISRDEIVSTSVYDRLKAMKKTDGEKSSFRYNYRVERRSFNKDVLSCLASCQQYDFVKSEVFLERYKGNKLFEKVINQYKQKYQKSLSEAQSAAYDVNGIVRIAHSDPAYCANELLLSHATADQKRAINENLLLRHHFKNMMHEKWDISKKAPGCVHEALYNIIGTDGIALADVSSLQRRIEDIVKAAPENERDTLVKAFYLPNGVLKEYAQHFSDVKHIKMPKEILTKMYDAERQKLNNLMCEQIKCPSKGVAIKATREHLNGWLGAKNTKDAIESRDLFNKAYANVFNDGLLVAPVETLGGDIANAPGKPQEVDGYAPPKNWDGKKVKHRRGWGWPDKKGNVWIPSGPNGHGGPHWDVQKPNGDYDNVVPGGKIRGQK